VRAGQHAVLIVDTCNPKTRGELATICTSRDSKVSLLTVEYNIGDDEPEQTEVFRLTGTSINLVEKWIKREFKNVSQIGRKRIAEFSGGNFRVASDGGTDPSPLFLQVMSRAPDKDRFLGNIWNRLHPSGWIGSLADILERRKAALLGLVAHPEVQAWLAEQE
jgi:hypothetical protein